MLKFMRRNTIDGITASLTELVDRLDKVRSDHLLEADIADEVIEEMEVVRSENLADAARAEKIVTNVRKLLDIS